MVWPPNRTQRRGTDLGIMNPESNGLWKGLISDPVRQDSKNSQIRKLSRMKKRGHVCREDWTQRRGKTRNTHISTIYNLNYTDILSVFHIYQDLDLLIINLNETMPGKEYISRSWFEFVLRAVKGFINKNEFNFSCHGAVEDLEIILIVVVDNDNTQKDSQLLKSLEEIYLLARQVDIDNMLNCTASCVCPDRQRLWLLWLRVYKSL